MRIDPDYLDELKEIHRDDPSKCFRAMLIKWLKTGRNCNLNNFLHALKNEMVGCGCLCQDVENAIMLIVPESTDPIPGSTYPVTEDPNPKPLPPSQETHNGQSQTVWSESLDQHRRTGW